MRFIRIIPYLPIPTLLVIAACVGFNTLQGEFVWDDLSMLVFKPAYRSFDLQRIFLSLANDVEYLPVRDISYCLDFAVWGLKSFGFHLTNLIIYCLTCGVVYATTRNLLHAVQPQQSPLTGGKIDTIAFMTALLFTVHPIHSESLAFITQRNTLLAGLFFFLSILTFLYYLQGRRRVFWYLLSLAACLASVFSKGISITLPLVIALTIVTTGNNGRFSWRTFIPCAPFMAVACGSFLVFSAIGHRTNIIRHQLTPPALQQKLSTAIQIPTFYLNKLYWPVSLVPEYDAGFSTSLFSTRVISSAMLLAAITIACGLLRRRQPALYLAVGWFTLTLLPLLNLFPTYPLVADRYAYLPSFGVCLATASIACSVKLRSVVTFTMICGAVAIVWLGKTMIAQNRIWQSDLTLWTHTVEASPGSIKGYINLACLVEPKNLRLGLDLARQAREINPSDPTLDYLNGKQLLNAGDLPSAIAAFNRAVSLSPGHMASWYHMAQSYERLGNRSNAVAAYRQILLSSDIDMDNYRDIARENLARLGAL